MALDRPADTRKRTCQILGQHIPNWGTCLSDLLPGWTGLLKDFQIDGFHLQRKWHDTVPKARFIYGLRESMTQGTTLVEGECRPLPEFLLVEDLPVVLRPPGAVACVAGPRLPTAHGYSLHILTFSRFLPSVRLSSPFASPGSHERLRVRDISSSQRNQSIIDVKTTDNRAYRAIVSHEDRCFEAIV